MRELTEREKLVDFTAAEKVKVKILKDLSEISIFLDENVNNGGSQIVQKQTKAKVEEIKKPNINKKIGEYEETNTEETNDISNKEILDLSSY